MPHSWFFPHLHPSSSQSYFTTTLPTSSDNSSVTFSPSSIRKAFFLPDPNKYMPRKFDLIPYPEIKNGDDIIKDLIVQTGYFVLFIY